MSVLPSLKYRRLAPSGLVHLDVCLIWRGRADWGLEVDVCVNILDWGLTPLGTHKHRTLSEEISHLRSWIGSCLIEDRPSGCRLPN